MKSDFILFVSTMAYALLGFLGLGAALAAIWLLVAEARALGEAGTAPTLEQVESTCTDPVVHVLDKQLLLSGLIIPERDFAHLYQFVHALCVSSLEEGEACSSEVYLVGGSEKDPRPTIHANCYLPPQKKGI